MSGAFTALHMILCALRGTPRRSLDAALQRSRSRPIMPQKMVGCGENAAPRRSLSANSFPLPEIREQNEEDRQCERPAYSSRAY